MKKDIVQTVAAESTAVDDSFASPTCPRHLSETEHTFAVRLRLAREGLEMSQGELSKRSGLPPSSISHFEAGRRGPSLDNLVRLVRAMPGLNANWLLGLTIEKTTNEYEDGYSDAISDAEEALIGLRAAR